MEQLFRVLFVGLLADVWMSFKMVHCQNLYNDVNTTSFCYDTRSGKTCFTTFTANGSHPVRKPFKEARQWCKVHVPGSSLIVINSLESQSIVQNFTGRKVLANEEIIMDAEKLRRNESLKWSWVNGQPAAQKDITSRADEFHVGACVELRDGQLLTYCFGNVTSLFRYICEYSDSRSATSYQAKNKSYVASEVVATWYDARNECLRLGGDLVSITSGRTTEIRSRLTENQKYWIGLHRNKWIWKSTGTAITFTKWEDGYPVESSDKQCICIRPNCSGENNRTICGYDWKWRICNCNHIYAIVCQREMLTSTTAAFKFSAFVRTPSTRTPIATTPTTTTTSTKTPIATTPTTTTTSTQTPIAATPTTTTTTTAIPPFKPVASSVITYTSTIADDTAGEIDRNTAASSSMTQNPSNQFADNQTTAFPLSSTGLFNSFNKREVLLILLLLFGTVVFSVLVVILVIRKCKKRNERSSMKKTKQEEPISSEYETMFRDKRRSHDIAPIYTELELTQQPMPSSNTIYANVQSTYEAVAMGINVFYGNPHEV